MFFFNVKIYSFLAKLKFEIIFFSLGRVKTFLIEANKKKDKK